MENTKQNEGQKVYYVAVSAHCIDDVYDELDLLPNDYHLFNAILRHCKSSYNEDRCYVYPTYDEMVKDLSVADGEETLEKYMIYVCLLSDSEWADYKAKEEYYNTKEEPEEDEA